MRPQVAPGPQCHFMSVLVSAVGWDNCGPGTAAINMQYGGRPLGGEPVIVGERGPELFVPDRSGTVYPAPPASDDGWARADALLRQADERMKNDVPYADEWLVGNKFNDAAFADWLANAPESENIEDRRGYDPTREAAMRAPYKSAAQQQAEAWERARHERELTRRAFEESVGPRWRVSRTKRKSERKGKSDVAFYQPQDCEGARPRRAK